MNTTLEDYIASNTELQETINSVKAQINATKMKKSLLEKLSELAIGEELEEDIVEISIDEQDQQLWNRPSSEKTVSLNFEFEKIADISDELKINEGSGPQMDLRQILDEKRSKAVDNGPSITSQQWRLREPNVGRKPAGMPPLVPISLLNEISSGKVQKKRNKKKARKLKRDGLKGFRFLQTRNKIKSDQVERPKVWDCEPSANSSVLSARPSSNENLPQNPGFEANAQNFAAFINDVGGVQYLPLNAVIAAATNFNGNVANGALMANSGYSLPLNNLSHNENMPFGIQRSAGNTINKTWLARSNLNGIRGDGRVERGQHATLQNNYNLQNAVKMFLNVVGGNDNDPAGIVDETSASRNVSATTLLSTAFENMLKRGIVIKLAEPGVKI